MVGKVKEMSGGVAYNRHRYVYFHDVHYQYFSSQTSSRRLSFENKHLQEHGDPASLLRKLLWSFL